MAHLYFWDEVIQKVNNSNEPCYTITHSGGTLTNAKLKLENAVSQAGTPLSAANMNRLLDFDNPAFMKLCSKTITATPSGLKEDVRDSASGALVAWREITFNGDGSVKEYTRIKDGYGSSDMSLRTVNITFPGGDVIAREDVV